ncbi:glycosyl transferase family protein [Seongchinamella sediminis]|uniref:Glycosyl transferase family protein n=1 Tax=Seongchinamella sediminis TaxID=2283635 RepID=A0A3L7E3K3_9GAMM|nr:glycosyl transferase family protein [Seongchinamella sediminis]RLQ23063.1 glycosyl transferase family protein [Seongchinamella sediminis]
MNQTPFQAPADEHPFAPYVRILGKGRTGSRSLDREEAAAALAMILRDEVQPLQLGAFLMLLRVKEETGEELAGFVDACRQEMLAPPDGLAAALDWSSYAGKKHQHPWYLLSMLLLAGAGYRVFVHGGDGHTAGRLYTEQAMRELGLPVADSWESVSRQLDEQQLSYLPLRHFCPRLHDIMQLRPLLGLRSPVNTLVRMLNPLRAAASIQSVFHPAYGGLHRQADRLLQQPRSLVFKGDSGEVEVKPQADTRLLLLDNGSERELPLPRTLPTRVAPVAQPATAPLRALWADSAADRYGSDSVIATTAAALLVLEPDWDLDHCRQRADQLWHKRDRGRLA